jgi:predicted DCC family thiol-disulfide oxidoreductase YuxK
MRSAILLYDATCRFCTAGSKRALWVVPRGSVVLADVNDAVLQAKYGVTPEAAKRAMHLVTQRGRVSAGAYAVRDLLRMSRWAWPFANLWRIPGFAWLANHIYSWVADHRYLFMGKEPPGKDACDDGCELYLGRPRHNA